MNRSKPPSSIDIYEDDDNQFVTNYQQQISALKPSKKSEEPVIPQGIIAQV